ncbi:ArsR/SmtB family transcription factor [Pelagibacterium montanilacus]|uniref:ArsR/SmtB family transcription factor n=1 Tax=Pelagibacterium montanilacus TaxID=2185280 RepID=UPI000F8EDAE8|nr:metalloregulator ArsR/SmtB family transcription factor [Pelagibacterium montanilacus]
MSSEDESDRIFKALGDRKRRAILDALKDEPRTTGQLVALFPDIDRCTVMLHIRVLEGAGLLIARREGRERWNHLNALPIKSIHERWIGDYARNAVSMMSKLEKALAP